MPHGVGAPEAGSHRQKPMKKSSPTTKDGIDTQQCRTQPLQQVTEESRRCSSATVTTNDNLQIVTALGGTPAANESDS